MRGRRRRRVRARATAAGLLRRDRRARPTDHVPRCPARLPARSAGRGCVPATVRFRWLPRRRDGARQDGHGARRARRSPARTSEHVRAPIARRRATVEYLDGRTRDRQARVERFQQSNCPLFLISLKAGGLGLNLTVAKPVFLLDPWWNPAVDAGDRPRASDRPDAAGVRVPAHRPRTRSKRRCWNCKPRNAGWRRRSSVPTRA